MKKILSFITIALLALTCTACGSDPSGISKAEFDEIHTVSEAKAQRCQKLKKNSMITLNLHIHISLMAKMADMQNLFSPKNPIKIF